MRYFVTIDRVEHAIDVAELPGGGFDVRLAGLEGLDPASKDAGPSSQVEVVPVSGRQLEAELIAHGRELTVRIGGRVIDLVLDGEPPNLEVFASGRRAGVRVESARMRAAAAVRERGGGTGGGVLVSPMPGKVVKVLVKEGDEVAEGAPVAVVEAMKMENELVAPRSGIVQKVYVQAGDAVEGGAQLIAIG
jgi:glutaconyl-CoA/methylmalonyl-CoA decarboxylase subunit gamma